jgi:hypothetical protein
MQDERAILTHSIVLSLAFELAVRSSSLRFVNDVGDEAERLSSARASMPISLEMLWGELRSD